MSKDTQKSESDKLELLKQSLQKSKCELFADRDSPSEAYEYAMLLAKTTNMQESVMATALMVYHNSLLKAIEDLLDDEPDQED